jgi:hypothetical protein
MTPPGDNEETVPEWIRRAQSHYFNDIAHRIDPRDRGEHKKTRKTRDFAANGTSVGLQHNSQRLGGQALDRVFSQPRHGKADINYVAPCGTLRRDCATPFGRASPSRGQWGSG